MSVSTRTFCKSPISRRAAMLSGPCLVFCLALATGPSPAIAQQTGRNFISVQTPFDKVELTDARAFVKVMPGRGSEGMCAVNVWGGERESRDDPRAGVALEFQAPCSIIFQYGHVSLELGEARNRRRAASEPGPVYGFLRVMQPDPSRTSRYKWRLHGGEGGTQFVDVDWQPECRISGSYQGYGLRYHDGKANVSYDVDVSMTFEARFVVGSVFEAATKNWGCKDDPDKAPRE